ncbi:MAG: hypothetical protein ACPG7W_00990 [Paracoccaceae bacterium]
MIDRDTFDVRHPMFRPVWVRVLVCAVVLGWAAWEFRAGAAFFGVIAGLSGAYLVHQFFWVFDPKEYEEGDRE